ncbi:MAG TPA: 2-(1,2-epoxy-1,2-dihydrophenyl)acetyl-CoA isomerase PaaG [Methylibium sp.]|uniref:2-(1,2-epoxy-1,2-dihydrophenyl)acetyl-CoA isomerase PaaG n=1 Tax=Methylibium sp. TaxID=2067992 RepID=UPI002DBA5403|nr:2-(1,2-epoxy-1,2-dihydrophenyl)acetyl-CoA isomerase PaaG [Methylibium sp.]HEU4457759.1 2-(1,2-epoxy-1,2-dihydrophenyl)acetyl-CoA isomerase PaaG [Methylibium sp.]
MPYQQIVHEARDGIARITLNRPDKLNSFTATMHGELREALADAQRAEVRVVVLTGAGKGFCAGQDLGERRMSSGAEAVDLGETIDRFYAPLVRAIRALDKPVIAAVNGVAAGAGCNVALACDLVVAARSASFIQPFCRLGLVPDAGGTWSLPRLVGPARAAGLALLGDKLSAEDAERWGLIWRCIDDAAFAQEVDALAARLAAGATRGLATTKRLLQSSWRHTLDEQLDAERDAQRELGRSADYAEGVAAFLDKRPARFTGR